MLQQNDKQTGQPSQMSLIGPVASALISSKDADFSDIWELQRTNFQHSPKTAH